MKRSSGAAGSFIRTSVRMERLARLRRITVRDRRLLAWLAEHYLLSTDQITSALFPSLNASRRRLRILHALEAVTRFVDTSTGTGRYLYALGPLGMLVEPTIYHDPNRLDSRPSRTSIERTERIVGSHRINHLLGTNQLFIDLIAYARTHPEAALQRWWSEQHTTAAYAAIGIRPDGHGIWSHDGHRIGFFLEHDNGTESLGTVLAKLDGYQRLATIAPPQPVLIRVPSERRQTHLLEAISRMPTAIPVAIGTHRSHPAARSWILTSDPSRLRAIHELPTLPISRENEYIAEPPIGPFPPLAWPPRHLPGQIHYF